ncbi:MAG: efflux RND transporter periplasmic adaptor subunit [Bacteroidota bacterium]
MNKKNRVIFYILLVSVVTLIIFFPKIKPLLWEAENEGPEVLPAASKALNVDAMIVKTNRLVEQVNSSGTLIPEEEVDLAFETSGKLVELYFDEGTRVNKGQLLAKINDRPLKAQLLKLEAQKKLAEEREFRQRKLLSRDAISQESYDQIATEIQTIEADIMLLEARIAETELRAPFDGVVGLRYVSEGAFVNVSTQIARLIQVNPLKIEFAIPERYSGEIQPGFPIRFSLDGFSQSFDAMVYAVDPKVNIRTRNIVVRARYNNPDPRVKPGRFVSIELELSEINDALSIPTEALIPEMDGDKVFVYRSGQAESVEVQTGLRTEEQIQITSGLQPGDTLVTTGILQLRHGMPLTIDHLL